MAAKMKFAYTARDATGKEVKGTFEVDSRDEVLKRLRDQNLTPVTVSQDKKREGGAYARRCSTAELAMFTRQLATMIGAGIPLLESYEILAEQSKMTNKGFGYGLQDCADLVRGGTELSEAMHQFPRMFPDIYINMVKAGESSGQLDVILNRLADFLEANETLKSEIKSAMTYPVISLILIFSITGYLLVGVVPKFESMFKKLGGKLPALTQFVVDISRWLQGNIITCIVIIVVVVVGYILLMRTYIGQRYRDLFMLKAPVFGSLSQKVALSRFARTFGTLLASGVPLLGALEIVASTAGNKIIEEVLLETRESVRRGEPLSNHLATSWVFPPMVVKMISIGEKSGALEQLLSKISDFYDQQVHAMVKSLTSLIEPIMLMVMGAVVGTIVAAIFLPILEIQKSLQKN
ncbi:phytochrome sensor protein [Planctomycetota bacterium]|nr:phytochrome sensor protein [Planctomycetota bacterium]